MTGRISPIAGFEAPRLAAWVTLLCVAGVVYAGEVEPNDTLGTATPTGLVDSGTVCLSGAQIGNGPLEAADRDLFSFVVSPASEYPVRVTAELTGSDPGFDGYLRLFRNEDGLEFARNDDATPLEPNPVVHSYLLSPQTYFVGVSQALNPIYLPADADTGRNAGMGTYQLCITLSPAGSLDESIELEGDLPVTGGPFPYERPSQFIGDGPDGILDVDRYSYFFELPGKLTVRVRPAELANGEPYALDPIVTVMVGSFPTELEFEENSSPHADGPDVLVELAILEPGDVEIQVKGTRPSVDLPAANARYGSVGFYDLSVDATIVAPQAGPFEPNDSVLQATPISLTSATFAERSAQIGDGVFGAFRGDVDFFEVTIRPLRHLDVTVSPAQPATLEPVIELYDFLGVRLGRWMPDGSGATHAALDVHCADPAGSVNADGHLRYVLAVMGARDRSTLDPLTPNQNQPAAAATNPPVPMFPLYALDGGPGSTGPYTIQFQTALLDLAACGLEPDDAIGMVSTPIITGQGEFHCLGRLNDGPCKFDPTANVDLFRVQVTQTPAVLEAQLLVRLCGATRSLRLFNGAGTQIAASVSFGPASDRVLNQVLTTAGTYYLGVSYGTNSSYNPHVACSDFGVDSHSNPDQYELKVRLQPSGATEGTHAATPGAAGAGPPASAPRLFATDAGSFGDVVRELDALSGQSIAEFRPPETPLGGAEGLAFDGTDLHLAGRSGRFPFLYRLDPATGDVLSRVMLWFGSGIYGQFTAYGGRLYVVDLVEQAVFSSSLDLTGAVTRWDAPSGVTLRGPVAVVAPDRLVASDVADGILHSFDLLDGSWQGFTALTGDCPCNADFDSDGDVDDHDAAFFEQCRVTSGVAFGCRSADLDCDDDLNSADVDIFDCQRSGPDVPPHAGCCPANLPPRSARATSLATVGPSVLLAGDWTEPVVHRLSPIGQTLTPLVVASPVGAMAAGPVVTFADADADGDLDLLDWSGLQICFTGPAVGSLAPGCVTFDSDLDFDVDLTDYQAFLFAITADRSLP